MPDRLSAQPLYDSARALEMTRVYVDVSLFGLLVQKKREASLELVE